MPELNACPICGKQPRLSQVDGYPMQYKFFCGVHVSVGDWFSNTLGAEVDWNRRTTDPMQPDLYKPTNADRIRAMSDEELARERIEFNYNPNGADYYSGDFGSVDVVYNAGVEQPESYAEALRLELNWLQQPAEEG